MFIINFKNYNEISGLSAVKLAKIAGKISKKYRVRIAVAPPQHLLSEIAKYSIPVLAQHLDNASIGSTTGFIIPEIVKKSGVKGSLINHSEHRIAEKQIKSLVLRLKKLDMISVVCVKNVSEAKKYARLNPNYIAIEPPELIGTGKAVSKEKPEVITKSVVAVKQARNSTKTTLWSRHCFRKRCFKSTAIRCKRNSCSKWYSESKKLVCHNKGVCNSHFKKQERLITQS